MALTQGTIHSARLLIKTMCGVAGPAGGSSGNQAWPGAWGSEGWGEGAGDPQAHQAECTGTGLELSPQLNTYQKHPEPGSWVQAGLWETRFLSR